MAIVFLVSLVGFVLWLFKPEQPRPAPLIQTPRLYLRGVRHALPRMAHEAPPAIDDRYHRHGPLPPGAAIIGCPGCALDEVNKP